MDLTIAKLFLQFRDITYERFAFLSEQFQTHDSEIQRLNNEINLLKKKVDLVVNQNNNNSINSIIEKSEFETNSDFKDAEPPF